MNSMIRFTANKNKNKKLKKMAGWVYLYSFSVQLSSQRILYNNPHALMVH